MGAPATNGKLCTKLTDMSIGDYIAANYEVTAQCVPGNFKSIGDNSDIAELSPDYLGTSGSGKFYFIKVDKGLLIADRLIQRYTSAEEYNKKGRLTGVFDQVLNGLVRTPTVSELRVYILYGTLNGNCKAYDDAVWHMGNYQDMLCQDRSSNTIKYARFNSPGNPEGTAIIDLSMNAITLGGANHIGWRPCVDYIDNPKSTNIWY